MSKSTKSRIGWWKGKKIPYSPRPNAKGKLNHRWKGGTTNFQIVLRGYEKYTQWRSDIFQRDNWNCQTCNKKGGELEVHHIKSFSKILLENNIKTIKDALKCKELWDLNNGITLCKDCHKLTNNYKNKQS